MFSCDQREIYFDKILFILYIIIKIIVEYCTCAGTAISPTDIPQTTLPIKIVITLFEKPMISQPMHRGIADNCKLPRRPIASNNGPDSNEPTGVARL